MAYKGSRAASLSLSVLHPRGSTPRAVAPFCPRTWCRRPLRGCSRISVTRASRGDGWLSVPRPALPLSCLPVWGTRSSLWVQLFPNVKGKACLEQFFSLNVLYSRGRLLIFHRLVASAHAGCREIKAELGGRVSGGWWPGPRDLPTPPLQPAWPSGDPPVPQSTGLHGLQSPRLL